MLSNMIREQEHPRNIKPTCIYAKSKGNWEVPGSLKLLPGTTREYIGGLSEWCFKITLMCTCFCQQSLGKHQTPSIVGELTICFEAILLIGHHYLLTWKLVKGSFGPTKWCPLTSIPRKHGWGILLHFNTIHKKMNFTKEHFTVIALSFVINQGRSSDLSENLWDKNMQQREDLVIWTALERDPLLT